MFHKNVKDEIFSVLQYLGKLLNGVGVGVVHLKTSSQNNQYTNKVFMTCLNASMDSLATGLPRKHTPALSAREKSLTFALILWLLWLSVIGFEIKDLKESVKANHSIC